MNFSICFLQYFAEQSIATRTNAACPVFVHWDNRFKKKWAQQHFRVYRKKRKVLDGFFQSMQKKGEQKPVIAYGKGGFASGGAGEVSVPTEYVKKKCKMYFDTVEACYHLAREHNDESSMPHVYITYQTYRRRAFSELVRDVESAKRDGFKLGVKLVRGAYLRKQGAFLRRKRRLTDRTTTR